MQSFEESPTSQHWLLPVGTRGLTYEHVLSEAGELEGQAADGMTAAETSARARDPSYYSELLFVLTHKRYPAASAERLWQRIVRHRDALRANLKRNPGIAVAALDFLTNVEHGISRPTFIDEVKLARLVDSATHDALTGLYHRSVLTPALTRALADRHSQVSVIMLDLDHFKRFNDSRGHLAGDRVLAKVGAILQKCVRDTDLAIRFGGEEFCVVLPGRGADEAARVAERLRARIERDLRSASMTASLGVATSEVDLRDPTALLHAADEALYASKHAGRNRVSSAGAERALSCVAAQ